MVENNGDSMIDPKVAEYYVKNVSVLIDEDDPDGGEDEHGVMLSQRNCHQCEHSDAGECNRRESVMPPCVARAWNQWRINFEQERGPDITPDYCPVWAPIGHKGVE